MWLDLLRAEVEKQGGSITAVAAMVGMSRSAISLALSDKYPGGTDKLAAKVLLKLSNRVHCPHLARDIAADECRSYADRPMPMSRPAHLRHWTACRNCPQKPKQETK